MGPIPVIDMPTPPTKGKDEEGINHSSGGGQAHCYAFPGWTYFTR